MNLRLPSALMSWVTLLVATAALASPPTLTPDTSIGPNDFRISDMPPDGNAAYDAYDSAVAYDPSRNRYLVVWSGDVGEGGLVDGELEIWGQFVDGDGTPIGIDFRISEMGTDGDANRYAAGPAVVYNPTADEYLVAWSGNHFALNSPIIHAQRITGAGTATGTNDFVICDSSFADSGQVDLAVDPVNNMYLVVWLASGSTLLPGEYEVYARLVTATGVILPNSNPISDVGGLGIAASSDASRPAVAFDPVDEQYLVVWQADDPDAGLADDEYEIFGQRLDKDRLEIGSNDFRISDVGGTGSAASRAEEPEVAFSTETHQYLVVWQADDPDAGLADNETEIFAQRLSFNGGALGANDFRVSSMGPDGDSRYQATKPAVAWSPSGNEYLVVWQANSSWVFMHDDELEIWAQRLDALGAERGTDDERISDVGGLDDPARNAFAPAVAASTTGEALAVWQGDDTVGVLVDNEFEIYGQRLLTPGFDFADGFEGGSLLAWASHAP